MATYENAVSFYCQLEMMNAKEETLTAHRDVEAQRHCITHKIVFKTKKKKIQYDIQYTALDVIYYFDSAALGSNLSQGCPLPKQSCNIPGWRLNLTGAECEGRKCDVTSVRTSGGSRAATVHTLTHHTRGYHGESGITRFHIPVPGGCSY
ncbi:hypothetical protein J6590_055015 [Homalodisca vitripennis]|nr:hypothetical protein J6590_055015 [Homalodisca vitripennis]